MPGYMAYGMRIESELLLPELSPLVNGTSQVLIRIDKIDKSAIEAGSDYQFLMTGQGIILYWKAIGTFLIRDTTEIIVEPEPAVSAARLRLFLLGAVMSVLLHQRGQLVLHASTVATTDGAIAFLGEKGWGKSTMAALLHSQGYQFVTDDVLAVDMAADYPLVLPGFPQLKLWPDSLDALGQDAAILPRLHPQLEKRDCRVKTSVLDSAAPLRCIYLLDYGPKLQITPVASSEALLSLMPHWYCARFGAGLLESLGQAELFLKSAKLMAKVPIYRLRRPRQLSILPEVAQLIKMHHVSDELWIKA